MKKLFLIFLLPFMVQCAKDPVKPDDQPETTHKCYISKSWNSDDTTVYSVYERDAQNRTTSLKNYNHGTLARYTLYTYNGNEIAKSETFDQDGNLVSYTTLTHSGNDYTSSVFGKNDNGFQETSRYVLTYNNGTSSKRTFYSRDSISGELVKKGESSYSYTGNGLTISSHDINGELTGTTVYTFDDKKYIFLNEPAIFPNVSEHNPTKIISTDKDGKETYNFSGAYTYNENGYPLTRTNGGYTTAYQYDCK